MKKLMICALLIAIAPANALAFDIKPKKSDSHFIRVTKVATPSFKNGVKFDLCPNRSDVPADQVQDCRALGNGEVYPVDQLREILGSEKTKAFLTGATETVVIGAAGYYAIPLLYHSVGAWLLNGWVGGGATPLLAKGVPVAGAGAAAATAVAITDSNLNPIKRWNRAVTMLGEKTLADEDVTYSGDIQKLADRLDNLLVKSGR